MPTDNKKYLDQEGLKYLWSKISMEDYPNNETLIAILNAIDETKADSSHNQSASTITAGTFAGAVVAQTSSQTPATSLLRNSKLVTSDTNPSYNGEICWTYA